MIRLARRFGLGDIVSLKMLGERRYYIVVDHVDYSQEGDEQPNIKNGIILVYPIIQNPKIEYMDSSELVHISKFKSRDYRILMEYIEKEREKAGWFTQPEYLRIVGDDTIKYANNGEVREVRQGKPPEKKNTFGGRDIEMILNDNHTEILTEEYIGRMNIHLELLHIAIQHGDEANIKLQKEQLEKVRNKLIELEYFKLSQRR